MSEQYHELYKAIGNQQKEKNSESSDTINSGDQNSSSYFGLIPDEILANILKYLYKDKSIKLNDLKQLQFLSKRFNAVLNDKALLKIFMDRVNVKSENIDKKKMRNIKLHREKKESIKDTAPRTTVLGRFFLPKANCQKLDPETRTALSAILQLGPALASAILCILTLYILASSSKSVGHGWLG